MTEKKSLTIKVINDLLNDTVLLGAPAIAQNGTLRIHYPSEPPMLFFKNNHSPLKEAVVNPEDKTITWTGFDRTGLFAFSIDSPGPFFPGVLDIQPAGKDGLVELVTFWLNDEGILVPRFTASPTEAVEFQLENLTDQGSTPPNVGDEPINVEMFELGNSHPMLSLQLDERHRSARVFFYKSMHFEATSSYREVAGGNEADLDIPPTSEVY